MGLFANGIMPECSEQPEIFQGKGGGGEVVELGHFDEDFVKNTRKRPEKEVRQDFGFFCPRYS